MGERAKPQPRAPIGQLFLAQLRRDVFERNVEHGLRCLEEQRDALAELAPEHPLAAQVALLLAIWNDIGFVGPPKAKELLARFDARARSRLAISGYICLRMAQGMAALAEEAIDEAIEHFDFVLSLPEELDDRFLLSIAYYWKGRCLRRRGDYDEALVATGLGRAIANELGHPRMAAVMQALESWLFFQQGKWKEAVATAEAAEAVLAETDDYVALGNIRSFYGRMARREARFEKAIEHFSEAIELYRKRDPHHPNLARTHANLALSKRGFALQLQKRIDIDAERKRKSTEQATGARPSAAAADLRRRVTQLRDESFVVLRAANEIYRLRPTHHGLGAVLINAAYIHLDAGDFQHAEEEAQAAYRLGKEKSDFILMGRARTLECMIENAKIEEDLEGETDAGAHARRALEFSQEAIELAQRTQHRFLLSTAYLWRGLTQCNAFFDDAEAAQESYDLARAACNANPGDNIWKDLQGLRAKILRKGSVDQTLKAWSEGSIEGKSFRQISEEFAELVIARVWEREGRKVSRAASRLAISPKKVRRILEHVGRQQKK